MRVSIPLMLIAATIAATLVISSLPLVTAHAHASKASIGALHTGLMNWGEGRLLCFSFSLCSLLSALCSLIDFIASPSHSPSHFTLLLLAHSLAGYEHVTCGSVVKLTHAMTNSKLHSHDVKYGTGSTQQSVTGFPNADDTNSYWSVRGAHGEFCERG